MVDKHQAHLAGTLVKETSEYILNTYMDQFSTIKNNLLSVTSTLPESTTRPEHQLELLFGIGATLFSLYNYINTQQDTAITTRNKNSISSLTHIAEIQEDHLKHLEIEMATNRYFYLQNLKFNPALLVSATQDITMQAISISNKFLNTIQQLQLKRLCPDFLQG
jgi:pyruvoyl-dependent arginine decarboxylase (PvlArgDC)